MFASEYGHLEVVKYLIEKGADINVKNNEGNTSLDIAREADFIEVVAYLESLQ